MARYLVTSPVKHGGKVHRPGAVLTLDEDDAEDLEALGVVQATTVAADAADPAPPTTIPRGGKKPAPK